MPDQPPDRPAPRDEGPGSAAALALFAAAGVVALAFVWMQVHRRSDGMLSSDAGALRSYSVITFWMRHGFFASYGMIVPTLDGSVVYRWSTGAYMVSGYLAERVWMAVTGHYGWRLLALHNQLVTMGTSVLLALVAWRSARRLGSAPRRAIALGVGTQMVLFTFPDNLALYRDMMAHAFVVPFMLVFLLLELDHRDGRHSKVRTLLQAVTMAWIVAVEFVLGAFFVLAVVLERLLFGDRPALRRLVAVALLPAAISMTLVAAQGKGAAALAGRMGAVVHGSGFGYRSGLDGDAMFYRDHRDIAMGRDLVRAARPASQQVLFRWRTLFLGGCAAFLLLLAGMAAGRIHPGVTLVPLTLVLTWVMHAAVFSQAVTLHPYLFDGLLAAPLTLSLFGLLPALAEQKARVKGVVVLVAFGCALWLSMVQLRTYAVAFPAPQPPGAVAPPPSFGQPAR